MNWLTKIFTQKPTFPDAPHWESYRQYIENQPDKNTAFRDVRFVILDTETTGLDLEKDRILSIGAVAVRDQGIYMADSFEYYLKQNYEVQGEGIKIHGILPKHNLDGVDAPEVLVYLLEYLKGSIIVGHHIGFDMAMLNRAFERHLGAKIHNKILDTNTLAKRIDSPFFRTNTAKSYSLDALCEKYHVPVHERHTAAGDAVITAIVFVKLMGILEKKGVQTFGDFF